jgi:hypothetical protein
MTKRKMLSMKDSTSRPSSRKYSAMVSPVRPTRSRTPGGSFICPKTMATLSMTPDSCISYQRSLPSRERSPTPEKTEKPRCTVAKVRISSWMMTVLPTPAPPNTPVLPPRVKGAMRSITFSPVSRNSGRVTCSSKEWERAGGWDSLSASTGPRLSMGSPSTLKMRPRVAWPTGIVIGWPVLIASMPRRKPSVASMATQRTQSLPRCCCTSTVSLSPLRQDLDGVIDLGQVRPVRKLDIDDGTHHLNHAAPALLTISPPPMLSASVVGPRDGTAPSRRRSSSFPDALQARQNRSLYPGRRPPDGCR